ncbi:hypothetical protein ACJJTC_005457 [Scirpophaga incertulas]
MGVKIRRVIEGSALFLSNPTGLEADLTTEAQRDFTMLPGALVSPSGRHVNALKKRWSEHGAVWLQHVFGAHARYSYGSLPVVNSCKSTLYSAMSESHGNDGVFASTYI